MSCLFCSVCVAVVVLGNRLPFLESLIRIKREQQHPRLRRTARTLSAMDTHPLLFFSVIWFNTLCISILISKFNTYHVMHHVMHVLNNIFINIEP